MTTLHIASMHCAAPGHLPGRTARALSRALAWLLIALACAPAPLMAESPQDAQTVMLNIENDAFGGTDKYYTSGIKAAWISRDLSADMQTWPGLVQPLVHLFDRPGLQRSLGLAMGQEIYTPGDKGTSSVPPGDRPYAGWTYFSAGLHARTEDRLDILEATLGVIGPISLAHQTQSAFHELIGSSNGNGWDHQLKDEPGIILGWMRVWRIMDGTAEQFPFRGMGYDVLPHVSLAAGNILTYGNLGLQARLGWNLPTDFGVTVNRIADGVTAPAGTSDPRLDQGGGKGRKWGFHFLAGADGYGVARNIFLDGNTWRSSPHADKEPFVADLYTGIAGTWGRYKISFTESYRTKEFERQDSQGQLIGSITISYTW